MDPQEVWKSIAEVYSELDMKEFLKLLKEYLEENSDKVTSITDWMESLYD